MLSWAGVSGGAPRSMTSHFPLIAVAVGARCSQSWTAPGSTSSIPDTTARDEGLQTCIVLSTSPTASVSFAPPRAASRRLVLLTVSVAPSPSLPTSPHLHHPSRGCYPPAGEASSVREKQYCTCRGPRGRIQLLLFKDYSTIYTNSPVSCPCQPSRPDPQLHHSTRSACTVHTDTACVSIATWSDRPKARSPQSH